MSLFGFLAASRGRAEDSATDALHYLLLSARARTALIKLLQAVAPGLPEVTSFEVRRGNQAGSGVPDMVGLTASREVVVCVENKFFAGLTDNQPSGYLGGCLALLWQFNGTVTPLV